MQFLDQYPETRERVRAFWAGEMADRPPVEIRLPKPGAKPFPAKPYKDWASKWLDIETRADEYAHTVANTLYLGDALPQVFPNLGPEIYSAWCGCPLHFTETTSWSEPIVHDWETDWDKVRIDTEHPLLKAIEQLTDALIERSAGTFVVGLTDFHPGGDHMAALRDPANLATDLIEYPEYILDELPRAQAEYLAAYDRFYEKIRSAGFPASSWMGSLFGEGKFYIPSNDFSCMISPRMFEEFFLPGIREECRFYDQSVYHLDGPGALRHLDALLEIPELNAIQWVCGAGNEGYERWIPVYQKIQRAGKSIVLCNTTVRDLDRIFETLRPEGVYISGVGGVEDVETAEAVIRRVTNWR